MRNNAFVINHDVNGTDKANFKACFAQNQPGNIGGLVVLPLVPVTPITAWCVRDNHRNKE
jgi:hypothetical protein